MGVGNLLADPLQSVQYSNYRTKALENGAALLNTRVHPPQRPCKSSPFKFLSNPKGSKMTEADLDGVIRSIGKKQHKVLMDGAKKRHARLMGLVAKAKNKDTRDRYRQLAKATLLLASLAARRLQITAENAADSYARSIKRAVEDIKAAEEKAAKKIAEKNVKKIAKKS